MGTRYLKEQLDLGCYRTLEAPDYSSPGEDWRADLTESMPEGFQPVDRPRSRRKARQRLPQHDKHARQRTEAIADRALGAPDHNGRV